MPTTVVVGLQWGDEGKRKIIDLFAQRADVVIRCNGGNNAGGTIVNGHGEVILHLIPAGILNPAALCIIERGVTIHPPSLVEEMELLESRNVSLKQLKISPYAHLVMPWHIAEDRGQEIMAIRGTTLRGIGPCYQDKAGRRDALRVGDLWNKRRFFTFLESIWRKKARELAGNYGVTMEDFSTIRIQYAEARERLLPHIEQDPQRLIRKALEKNREILLEVAHGLLLDMDYGTYPYVTACNTTSAAACHIAGVSPREVTKIVGVAKAYLTRVGPGPFPTELHSEQGSRLRELGKEYGATTGRPRRCGWLHLPLLQYACRVNHVTEIALTKLDILGLLPAVRLGVGAKYRNDDPFSLWRIDEMAPCYQEYEGWGSISECNFRDELPAEAIRYLNAIQENITRPINYISTGSERKRIIVF